MTAHIGNLNLSELIMKKKLAVAAFLLATASAAPAQAQVDIWTGDLTVDATTPWHFIPFEVTAAGYFEIRGWYNGGYGDPMLSLFSGAASSGAGLGTYLGYNDDSSVYGSWSLQSTLAISLGVGFYTVAASEYYYTPNHSEYLEEVVSNTHGSQYQVGVYSRDGSAQFTAVQAVPEPLSAILLSTGLLGVGIVARRRKHALEG